MEGTTHGHFSPVSSSRFLNHNFEMIFHFSKDGKCPLDRLAVGVRVRLLVRLLVGVCVLLALVLADPVELSLDVPV